MRNQFGNPEQLAVTEIGNVIEQLTQQRFKIQTYQKEIEAHIRNTREMAKKLNQDGEKVRAVQVLKRKRYYEQALQRLRRLEEVIDRGILSLTVCEVRTEDVQNLQKADECLKEVNKSMCEVERILEKANDDERGGVQIYKLILPSACFFVFIGVLLAIFY